MLITKKRIYCKPSGIKKLKFLLMTQSDPPASVALEKHFQVVLKVAAYSKLLLTFKWILCVLYVSFYCWNQSQMCELAFASGCLNTHGNSLFLYVFKGVFWKGDCLLFILVEFFEHNQFCFYSKVESVHIGLIWTKWVIHVICSFWYLCLHHSNTLDAVVTV